MIKLRFSKCKFIASIVFIFFKVSGENRPENAKERAIRNWQLLQKGKIKHSKLYESWSLISLLSI